MKKAISILVLSVFCFMLIIFSAVADDNVIKGEEYDLLVQEDNTVWITKYKGKADVLEIPNEIEGYTVSGIGDKAFATNFSLTSVTVPNSITYIGEEAFKNCSHITSINLPDSLASISERTFYNCMGLESIALPNSIKAIGDYAFEKCLNLESVSIADGVTSIGNGAFHQCINLSSITIPDSVIEIGDNPFYDCNNISEIIVSPGHPALEVIDGVLFSKPDKRLVCYPHVHRILDKELATYTVPEGTEIIGAYAFYQSNLMSVTIPESVTTIGDYAFALSSYLPSNFIPETVTNIGEKATDGCVGMVFIPR